MPSSGCARLGSVFLPPCVCGSLNSPLKWSKCHPGFLINEFNKIFDAFSFYTCTRGTIFTFDHVSLHIRRVIG